MPPTLLVVADCRQFSCNKPGIESDVRYIFTFLQPSKLPHFERYSIFSNLPFIYSRVNNVKFSTHSFLDNVMLVTIHKGSLAL